MRTIPPRRFRIPALLCTALAVIAGCGGDDAARPNSTTTTVGSAVTSTVPATTQAGPVMLRADGIGGVAFGSPSDAAFGALRDALGQPDADDTIFGDMPNGLGGPRTTLRTVRWGQLAVSFVDWTGSPYRTDGSLHLVRWLVAADPNGGRVLTTPEGVHIGSTLPEIRQAYGSSLVVERDDCAGAWQIRVDNSALGVVGRLDASPDNPNARLVYLAAGLRSSC